MNIKSIGNKIKGNPTMTEGTSIEFIFQVSAFLPLLGIIAGFLPNTQKKGQKVVFAPIFLHLPPFSAPIFERFAAFSAPNFENFNRFSAPNFRKSIIFATENQKDREE